jgi:hypothetical protein
MGFILSILSLIICIVLLIIFIKTYTNTKNILHQTGQIIKKLDNPEKNNPIKEPELISEKDAKSITIKTRANGKTETIDMESWHKMKTMYGEDKYEVLRYH